MKVRMVYRPHAAWTEPWRTMREAAQLMRSARVSSLPVMVKDRLVGIVSARNVVEALAHSEQCARAHVVDYMDEEPRSIDVDDDCCAALTIMLAIGCVDLPVQDGGRLVGTVAALDLLPPAARRDSRGPSPPAWPPRRTAA